MKRYIYLIVLPIFLFLTNCGIQPPTQDLELAKAKLAEAEAVDANQYAPDEVSKAKDLLNKGTGTMVKEKSRKNKDAKENFTSALTEAEKAYNKSVPSYTEKNIQELETSLSKGREIKADVAVKDQYDQAKQMLAEARNALTQKDYKTSYTKAREAKTVADTAYQTALEKRTKAGDAIQDAKKSLDEVEKKQENR
jgi:hypothetical protein